MNVTVREAETRLPSTIARQVACAKVIRALWGKVPVRIIAETSGESYSFVQKVASEMGMPRLSTGQKEAPAVPLKPQGYPRAVIKWACDHIRAAGLTAPEDIEDARDAAMILAHTGRDVRDLGWR